MTSAQNAVKMIESNGRETIFLLNQRPMVSIVGKSLEIRSASDKITCEIGEGVSFAFTDFEEAGVEEIDIDSPMFRVSQNLIEAFNLRPNSKVTLYDFKGNMIKSVNSDATGYVAISSSGLPKGVYVINSNVRNFKYYKK